VSAEELIPRGEHVVVRTRTRVWGRGGREAEAPGLAIVTLRAGCIVEWRLYRDSTEALEAVGLQE